MPRGSQISIPGELKGFSFPNLSSPNKGHIINKLKVGKSGQTISPLSSLNQILGNMKLDNSNKSLSHNDKQIRRKGSPWWRPLEAPKSSDSSPLRRTEKEGVVKQVKTHLTHSWLSTFSRSTQRVNGFRSNNHPTQDSFSSHKNPLLSHR